MTNLLRFRALDERDINKETFVEPWPEAGLTVADSPYDPQPSLRIVAGRVVELDGRQEADFDTLDTFIAHHGIDLTVAPEAMALESLQFAHMLADINIPRNTLLRLATGCTPAKLVDIMRHMNVLEMMNGLSKMRVRRVPAEQMEPRVQRVTLVLLVLRHQLVLRRAVCVDQMEQRCVLLVCKALVVE